MKTGRDGKMWPRATGSFHASEGAQALPAPRFGGSSLRTVREHVAIVSSPWLWSWGPDPNTGGGGVALKTPGLEQRGEEALSSSQGHLQRGHGAGMHWA